MFAQLSGQASGNIRIPSIYKLVFGDVTKTDVSIQKTSDNTITVDGNLTCTGATCGAGASSIIGGATTQVQFNDAGAFAGSSKMTFDKVTGSLVVSATSAGDTYLSVNGTGGLNVLEALGGGVNVDANSTGGTVSIFTASGNIAMDPGATKHITVGGPSQSNSGHHRYQGTTSGFADFGVADVAGSPARVNLPIATGAANSVLTSDGGTPQQLSWKPGTRVLSVSDLAPVAGDDGLVLVIDPASAIHLTRFSCGVQGSTSVVVNLVKAATSLIADATCTAGDSNTVVVTTWANGSSQCGGTSSCAVAAHAPVTMHIGTVTGTPTALQVSVEYTVD